MSTNAAGRTTWNDKTRSDLLIATFDVAPPSAKEGEAIIEHLRAKGYTYNYSAALQHLQKLKKKDGNGNGSEPATPKKAGDAGGVTKAKKVATPKGTPTGIRRKAQALVEADDVDEDEEDEKPIKKLKLGAHAPNPGQNYEFEPAPPTDGLRASSWATSINEVEPESLIQDWVGNTDHNNRLDRFGYWKILRTCLQARKDGLNYLWVDTNCIDKTSSAELSEAINSMYQWYRNASICYAYLSDVLGPDPAATGPSNGRPSIHPPGISLSYLRHSRWFRRGWTLQELLAPRDVRFFSRNWTHIGTKSSLAHMLSDITRIDKKYLLYSEDIRSASIAQRMAAVADRTTTRPEDIAYCLLGLFDVNMPLLYGEGAMAFVRLQEEIIKVSDDHSIFAWTWITELTYRRTLATVATHRLKREQVFGSKSNYPAHRVEALLRNRMRRNISRATLLAPDPACFFDASSIPRLKPPRSDAIFTMTNAGLSISLPIFSHPSKKMFFAVIHEEQTPDKDTRTSIMIPLVLHYEHRDRWTRTWFPAAPITVVFYNRKSTFVPKTEKLQVCRDTQHVPFFYDAFGGTSHQFGFWLLLPQYQPTSHFGFRLHSGCVLGNGVYNSHGIFVDAEEGIDNQLLGGLLIFCVDIRAEDVWNKWRGKIIVLFLALELKKTPEGNFKKTNYYCRILARPPDPVEAPQLLKHFVAGLPKHSAGGEQSTPKQSFNDNVMKYTGYQEYTLCASVSFLNDVPLSHSPQSEITLTELNLWHSEERAPDVKRFGRGRTI
ncbi:HET-domain-containing protein [Xylariaceae sp. AK1471]|nr:HET-domain-containing protein [Xylariaceae sp. AK1471]